MKLERPVEYMARTREYYEAQGFERAYRWAQFDDVPFSVPTKRLEESRVVLISTAATYDRVESDPRFIDSGSSDRTPERLFANDLAWDKKATHLNDLGSFFPLELLNSLADEGKIGSVASRFHCIPTEYSQRRTIQVDAPELLSRCREDGVDVALLIPL